MTESSFPKEPISPKDQEIDQENEGFYHITTDDSRFPSEEVSPRPYVKPYVEYNRDTSQCESFQMKSHQGSDLIDEKSSHQDIDNLLKFAEDIKQVCDNYLNQLESLIFWRDCIILGLIILAFFSFVNITNNDGDWTSLTNINILKNLIQTFITWLILSVFTSVIINSRIKKLKSRFSYEQKVLEETVDLLREAGSIIKQEGHWTTLQEIEYKIRLSRFNIGKYQIPKNVLQEILSGKSEKN